MANKSSTLKVELYDKRCRLGVERIRVLFDESFGQAIYVLRKATIQKIDDFEALVCLLPHPPRLVAQEPSKS